MTDPTSIDPAERERALAPLIDPHKLGDLLDAYRSEVACETYNGWYRHKASLDVRKELDELLAAARAALSSSPQGGAEPVAWVDPSVVRDLCKGFDGAVYLHVAATKEMGEVPLYVSALVEQPSEPVALRIVFDGPPSHDGGRFVEIEDANGKSFNAGEWKQRTDGLWELRVGARHLAAHPVRESPAEQPTDTQDSGEKT